jgi:imidazolonepropionase-like amidohydrolase
MRDRRRNDSDGSHFLFLTQKAAHLLQLGDKVGTLEVGKKAGIVIVEGNPLEDIGRLANIRGIVNGGTLI